MDRPTGRVIRRYERTAPGELLHLDVKKVGKVPPGGGWRVHGRGSPKTKRRRRKRRGYTYLHVAIDDYSRVAYVEPLDDERADTLLGFWRRVSRGGGGNRTRVLQRFGESSPSAVAGGLSGDCGQRHPASRRSRLCVSPAPRRHGRRASPADDGTGARRTGATGPNSQPEIRLRAPVRHAVRDRRWRLYLFPALFRGSGDHGSLLSLQPSKSKPITPRWLAEPTLCGSRSAGYHPSDGL